MPQDDFGTLRQVLREAVRSTGLSHRKLEDRLGIGHGNMERLLAGQSLVKVWHLVVLARLLGVPPGDFLELGFPEATAGAGRRLAEVIAPPGRAGAAGATAQVSVEQLAELVREAVRAEMARQRS